MDVARASAVELAAAVRRRDISAVELVQEHLATIRARDPDLGAFASVGEASALRQARRADALLARGGALPPFLGVPTAIKHHEALRGHFMRLGSRAFRWLYAPVDGFVARACRRAGFVLVGKTACSELTILRFVPGTARLLEPTTLWLRERGRGITRAEVVARGRSIAQRVLAWLGDADVVVTPTVAQLPPRVGAFAKLDGEGVFRAAAVLGAFTAPFNVSGQPAITIPAARSRSGLPIGVQLVGRLGADRLLLALATALTAGA